MSSVQVSGVRFQVSAPPPANRTAGLIEKETTIRLWERLSTAIELIDALKSNLSLPVLQGYPCSGGVYRLSNNLQQAESTYYI